LKIGKGNEKNRMSNSIKSHMTISKYKWTGEGEKAAICFCGYESKVYTNRKQYIISRKKISFKKGYLRKLVFILSNPLITELKIFRESKPPR